MMKMMVMMKTKTAIKMTMKSPVLLSASILVWSLSLSFIGVSFRSTSFKLFDDPLDAGRPPNSKVRSASAISIATFASIGKNNLANATATQ